MGIHNTNDEPTEYLYKTWIGHPAHPAKIAINLSCYFLYNQIVEGNMYVSNKTRKVTLKGKVTNRVVPSSSCVVTCRGTELRVGQHSEKVYVGILWCPSCFPLLARFSGSIFECRPKNEGKSIIAYIIPWIKLWYDVMWVFSFFLSNQGLNIWVVIFFPFLLTWCWHYCWWYDDARFL